MVANRNVIRRAGERQAGAPRSGAVPCLALDSHSAVDLTKNQQCPYFGVNPNVRSKRLA